MKKAQKEALESEATGSENPASPHDHSSHEHTDHSEHQHADHSDMETMDRFPTREELRQQERATGWEDHTKESELNARVERHITEILRDLGLEEAKDEFSPSPFAGVGWRNALRRTPSWTDTVSLGEFLSRNIQDLIRATRRPRADHRTFDAADKARFNEALQTAYNDGSYQTLAAIHENMSHRMHTIMEGGYIGGQRFLPWHRIYTLKMENLLRSKRWGLTIPYWNYSADPVRPDWVWRPPDVTRNTPGNGASLPTQATVDNLINNVVSYDSFTDGLEFDAHNSVHNWCNGTISDPMTATRDPIFWLLHTNVDRIWDLWQAKRSGVPNLSGIDRTLDPWTQTIDDAKTIVSLGYIYI